MNKSSDIKESIYKNLHESLDKKIDILTEVIKIAKESRNNETKCTAGDKYETGRAMMQIEIEKNENQLSKTANLKKELTQINLQKKNSKVEYGSLVITNKGTYFIAIGVGKVIVNNENYYSISLASPIGKLLFNKEIGDKIRFQNNEFEILDVC